MLNQHGQVLAEEAALAAGDTLVVVAGGSGVLLAAALAPRQASGVAAFEEPRLSGAHILAAEVLAGQASHLDSIMVVIA